MSDFLNEAFDYDTVAAQAKMEEKDTYVYVEGMDDVDFWNKIFDDSRIDVSSASQKSNKSHKGKSALRKLLPQANKKLIIAIDSDFDFLCPNNSQQSMDFNNCEYVIQTFFYSKENITFQPTSIDINLEKTSVLNKKISSNYKSYIEDYSAIIYECFVKFLFLRNMGIKSITSKKFHSKITPNTPIFNDEYNLKNDPFSNVRKNILEMDAILNAEIHKIENWNPLINTFKNQISLKGLSKEKAHCFINGHTLEDSIVSQYVNGKVRALKRNLSHVIKKECESDFTLINNRCNEASNIIMKKHNFFTRINDCTAKYSEDIVKKIKSDISKIRS